MDEGTITRILGSKVPDDGPAEVYVEEVKPISHIDITITIEKDDNGKKEIQGQGDRRAAGTREN